MNSWRKKMKPVFDTNEQAITEGLSRLKLNAPEHCVAIRLSLTSQGYELSYEVRSPDELRKTNTVSYTHLDVYKRQL